MVSFLQISPTAVHRCVFGGAGAWKGASFPDSASWIYRFPAEVLRQIDGVIGQDRFELPSFASDAARLRRELRDGRGFVVLRGLPVDRYTEEEMSLLYWGLGALIAGRPLPQNVKGDRLYSVRDEGYRIDRDYGRVGVRFSKTTEALNFHTDSAPALMGNTPDVVGLLALQVARSGGESALVSALTAHNELLARNPAALERLYRPYHFDRSAEWREGEPRTLFAPVFTCTDGRLAVRHFRFYIPKGHELTGTPLTAEDTAALDALDAELARPELQVRFHMEPGDVQLVSNVFVLHARTAFEDYEEPARKRHLKRLWLQFD